MANSANPFFKWTTCLIVAGVILFAATWPPRRNPLYVDDDDLLKNVQPLLMEMIRTPGEPIAGTGGFKYVVSFADFCAFLHRTHPEIAIAPNAANPFPGLLHGTTYKVLVGQAHAEDDILISTRLYPSHAGTQSAAITCGGRSAHLSETEYTTAFAAQPRSDRP